jgi:membrane protease YdiL (CAAX protease family)
MRARWELLLFCVALVALTTLVMTFAWRLPDDFSFGDIRTIEDALNVVSGWLTALPAALALFITLFSRGPAAMLALLRRVLLLPPRAILPALLLPLLAQIPALAAWALLLHKPVGDIDAAMLAAEWLAMTPVAAFVLLGHEIGWRGFVLPRLLAVLSWRRAALLCGLLWAGWHMPLWLPAHIAATGSLAAAWLLVAANTLEALAVSVILTWLFLRTRASIAIPALMMGASNAGMSLVRDLLDTQVAEPAWPMLYALAISLVAAPFLLRGTRNQSNSP